MTKKETTIDYGVVTRFNGHQINKGVKIVDAAKDIFSRVKEKAMQCAVKGEFIVFDTVEDLQKKLEHAAKSGFRVAVYDQNIGG